MTAALINRCGLRPDRLPRLPHPLSPLGETERGNAPDQTDVLRIDLDGSNA